MDISYQMLIYLKFAMLEAGVATNFTIIQNLMPNEKEFILLLLPPSNIYCDPLFSCMNCINIGIESKKSVTDMYEKICFEVFRSSILILTKCLHACQKLINCQDTFVNKQHVPQVLFK